jgi:glycosyltransferase involved in cell wall biosynthesis
MKIFFDGQIFALQKFGGISRYIIELAEALRKQNEKIYIKPFFSKNEFLSKSDFFSSIIQTKELRKTNRAFHLANILYFYILSKTIKMDVIHLTFFSSWLKAFRPKGSKVILTVHDFTDEIDPSVENKKAVEEKYNSMSVADHIICISLNTQNDLKRLYPEFYSKSKVVYLGFNDFRLKLTNVIALEADYILFVGQRGRYKNFELLYNSYKLMDTKKIRLVAFGPKPTTDEKAKYADVDFVTGDDNVLANYYKNALVFVFPSSYEGFGIPSLEAMSLDCPIVIPESSCFPEIVGNAGHYFKCGDSTDLSIKIQEVINDKKLCKGLIEKGRKRFKSYSYENCAINTLKVYET